MHAIEKEVQYEAQINVIGHCTFTGPEVVAVGELTFHGQMCAFGYIPGETSEAPYAIIHDGDVARIDLAVDDTERTLPRPCILPQ